MARGLPTREALLTDSMFLALIVVLFNIPFFFVYLREVWSFLYGAFVPSGTDIGFHAWLSEILVRNPSAWFDPNLFSAPGTSYGFYFAFSVDLLSKVLSIDVVSSMKIMMLLVMTIGPILYGYLAYEITHEKMAFLVTAPIMILFSSSMIQTLGDSLYPFLVCVLVLFPVGMAIYLKTRSNLHLGIIFGFIFGFNVSLAPVLLLVLIGALSVDESLNMGRNSLGALFRGLKALVEVAIVSFLISLPSLWIFWKVALGNIVATGFYSTAPNTHPISFSEALTYLFGYSPSGIVPVGEILVFAGLSFAGLFLILFQCTRKVRWLPFCILGLTIGVDGTQFFYADAFRYLRFAFLLIGLEFTMVGLMSSRYLLSRLKSSHPSGMVLATVAIGILCFAPLMGGFQASIQPSWDRPALIPVQSHFYNSVSISVNQTPHQGCKILALDSSVWLAYSILDTSCVVVTVSSPDVGSSFNSQHSTLNLELANALTIPGSLPRVLSENGFDFLVTESASANAFFPGNDRAFVTQVVDTHYNLIYSRISLVLAVSNGQYTGYLYAT